MRFSRSKSLMIVAGLVFGAVAACMSVLGNPPNMGVCIACFYRDITGALGFHQAAAVQYLRPEVIGIALGALVAALIFGDFRARGGSAPLIRFFLGAFCMIGALVFLGCPVRAVLRLAGGDLNAVFGIAGVIVGAIIGIYFLKRGFNLGRANSTYRIGGWVMPVVMVGLLLFAIGKPAFIYFSQEGPGSMHAPLFISLIAGLLIGFLAQRTRMCFVGGWRDLFLVKDTYLFSGIFAFFFGALIVNLIFGKVTVGFADQPIAHTAQVWNFLGMVLCGLAATLLGGCPLRQTVLASEGDMDAAITILGLIFGAAVSHNFTLASSAKGVTAFGPVAVIIGLIFTLLIGFFMYEGAKSAAVTKREEERLTKAG